MISKSGSLDYSMRIKLSVNFSRKQTVLLSGMVARTFGKDLKIASFIDILNLDDGNSEESVCHFMST